MEKEIIQLKYSSINAKEVPKNRIIEVEIEAENSVIDEKSKMKILSKIVTHRISINPLFDLFDLEYWLSQDWTSSKVNGSIAKRIAKWYYEAYKEKLDNDIVAEIGSMAQKCRIGETYYFDISTKVDWASGEFGDHGSCFWSSYSDAREFIDRAQNFGAIRIFNKKESTPFIRAASKQSGKPIRYDDGKEFYQGHSRAWLWSYPIVKDINKSKQVEGVVYVLFNVYGSSYKVFIELLSAYLQAPSKPLSVKNRGGSGGFYLNNGGKAWIIGHRDLIKDIEDIDFNVLF